MLSNRPRVTAEGALDLLYHRNGTISEAASASFYLVRGRTILAPASDVLWGTVGTFVVELASEHYPVERTELTLDDAYAADEAFLTSTTRGVVPIVSLDDTLIASGSVGPVTADLVARYRRALSELA